MTVALILITIGVGGLLLLAPPSVACVAFVAVVVFALGFLAALESET